MKRKTVIAVILAGTLGLSVLGGCTSAADDAISTAESGSSGLQSAASDSETASVDTKWEPLDKLNLDEFLISPDIQELIPADANLSGTKEDGSKWKIAWSTYDAADESQAYQSRISEELAEQYGFDLISFEAQGDPQKQADNIRQAITQGCDAIVVSPLNESACNSAMKEARDAGVIVVNCNMIVSDEDAYDFYAGPNDTEGGQMAASYLIDTMADGGNVVVIQGFPGSAAQINRDAGFMGVIQSHPEFDVLEMQTANWSTEDAMKVMESYLSKYPDIDAVFGHFDLATLAAIQAAEDVGRADDITFVSVDGTRGALAAISEGGCFKMTALQDFKAETDFYYLAALTLLNGGELEKVIEIPFVCIEQDNAGEIDPGWG